MSLSSTIPGLINKRNDTNKNQQWDETRRGYFESDTVVNCGEILSGTVAYSAVTNRINACIIE